MSQQQEILDLLANGKITAAEAADMLNAVGNKPAPEPIMPAPPAPPTPPTPPTPPVVTELEEIHLLKESEKAAETAATGKRPSWMHIRVKDMETGKNKVSVNIPMGVVRFGLNIGRRFSPELAEMDLDELNSAIGEAEAGIIVQVQDEEDGEEVLIYVD
jgi:hypothetical protein